MPIGGVKEKVLAAYRSGIRTVILPKRNEMDLLEDLPKELHEQMHFVFATDVHDVIETALEPPAEREEKGKHEESGEERPRRRKGEKATAKA